MTERLCVGAGDPHSVKDDGYVCARHERYAVNDLATIADLTEAARDVAMGQTRRGPAIAGTSGSGLELNLSATARLDAIANALVGWCRVVAEEWSLQIAVDTDGRPMVGDPLAVAATWLSRQMGLVRGRDFAGDALAEIADARAVMVGLIDGGTPKHYLGPCGAPQQIDITSFADLPGTRFIDGPPCEGDVYARQHATVGVCRTCRAEVDVEDRRQWLDSEVRTRAFRAAHIADAYRISVNTIRSWHMRARLFPAPRPDVTQPCLPYELWYDDRGRPLFLVGEVLKLAEEDATRRAVREAKRAMEEAA